MTRFVDGMVAPIRSELKDEYLARARYEAQLFKKHGALSVTECWGVNLAEPLSNQQFSSIYQASLDWKETLEGGGGDTLFADLCLAYELLSDTMRQTLEGLEAVHDGALPTIWDYFPYTGHGERVSIVGEQAPVA